MRTLRVALLIVAICAGVVVVSKALTGYPRSSPINPEGLFAVAFIALFFSRTMEHHRPSATRFLAPQLAIGLLIVAASFWGIQHITFLCDDYFVVLDAVRGRGAHFIDTLISDKGDVYYRPAAYSTLWLAAKALGTDPSLWHLHHLALHLLNCVLLYILAGQLRFAASWSAVAMVLFGVHGARPESVVWIAGYWELVSVAFVVASLILYLRFNHTNARINYVASLACCVLGLWSKESAYVIPALVFLLPLPDDTLVSRLKRTLPFGMIAAAAFIHRWIAIGGIGGYVNAAGQPEIGGFSILRIVKLLLFRLWATLFFPINWSVQPEPVVAITMALALAALLIAASTPMNRPFAIFCLAATVTSAIPASSQLLLGPDLQKSRLLYLPSVGACLLLAALFSGIPSKRLRMASTFAYVVFSIAALRHNLAIWDGVSQVMTATAQESRALTREGPHAVTVIGIPGSIRGVYFFMNGFQGCLDMGNGGYYDVEVLPPGSIPQRAGRTVLVWKSEESGLQKLAN